MLNQTIIVNCIFFVCFYFFFFVGCTFSQLSFFLLPLSWKFPIDNLVLAILCSLVTKLEQGELRFTSLLAHLQQEFGVLLRSSLIIFLSIFKKIFYLFKLLSELFRSSFGSQEACCLTPPLLTLINPINRLA